ncbi:MAG: TonB family protein [Prosthecobacter sp.]|jgi:protein TonB|nr:TonB family protein [Prosthecobacter sp.]
MSAEAARPQRHQSGKGGISLLIGRVLCANGLGILMTAFVFGVLPGLQIVTGGAQKKEFKRTVTSLTDTPPQESLLEDKPPPPPEQEEPPPQMETPLASLADISGALNPGGTGAAVLNNAMAGAVANQAMAAFSFGGDEVKPRPISTVMPRLTAAAKKAGASGTVKVQFVVDIQGRVQSPQIISTPSPALNQPTLEAIRQWRFEPGTRGGKKAPFKMMQPFTYGR